MNEIQEYLEQRGFKLKIVEGKRGPWFNTNRCPFCHSSDWNHFFVDPESGYYICHRCGSSGSFLTLKEAMGDMAKVSTIKDLSVNKEERPPPVSMEEIEDAHRRLLTDGKTLKYLHSRRFSMEAINHFKLGVSEEDGILWLWYPYIYKGTAINVKKRSLPPADKRFKRTPGGESTLLNEEIFDTKPEEIILTEGESDCISLWSAGVHNVVGVSIGAEGINTKWIDQLDKIGRIYLAYDSDEAGTDGAYKMANRLGIERCYRIVLPPSIKDVNSFFMMGYTGKQFLDLMSMAEPFHVQSVSSLGEEISKAIYNIASANTEETQGITLPWPKLDRLINGFMPGDLISMAGKPGVGKTSMALNIAYHFTQVGIPTLLFELEMRPQRILPALVALHTGKNRNEVMNIEILQAAYNDLKKTPFLFSYHYKKPNFDFCADTVRKCYSRYGLKFLIFDNLHFLVRSKQDQTREVSQVVQNFKLLAEELAIPILLIVRPRKTVHAGMITNEDLKDSADIEGDSDIVILLHRDQRKSEGEMLGTEGIFSSTLYVRVSKARFASGGDCILNMDDRRCRVTE